MRKNKRLVTGFALAAATVFCMLAFASCGLFEKSGYAVYYYYDGTATWTDSVKKGDDYTVSFTPEEKFGYTFDGWYDAKTGGNKCASADGKSIKPFSGKDDLILYPRFTPNPFTVRLDYGVADVTEGETVTALYEQTLPQLPANLTVEGKNFCGWYTKADCKGTMVSATDGVSQVVFDKTNFRFDREEFVLYAGFTAQTRTLTFRAQDGTVLKTAQAEYGSPLSVAANAVRSNGLGVLRWQGGVEGYVTEDREFIALEYAPVIELDSRGGQCAGEVIAEAGAAVTLPVPQKKACNFLYWADESGNRYTATVMPASGTKLKAVWQPKIVFDSNGGSIADEIVQSVGSAVKLPIPTRNGYLFGGWYTEDEVLFRSKTMPADGAMLRAGWYREKTVTKTVLSANRNYTPRDNKVELRNELTVDLSDILPDDFYGMIKVSGSMKLRHETAKLSAPREIALGFYNDKVISEDTVLMAKTVYNVTSSSYEKYTFGFEGCLVSNKIYGAAGCQWEGNIMLGSSYYGYFTDMSVTLTYADVSMLYL